MMFFDRVNFFLSFSRQQRVGIFVLFFIIISLQLVCFFVDFTTTSPDTAEKANWLALQSKINQLKKDKAQDSPKIYPFNPNFITDYKGYKLGMSVDEIDRLLAYRKLNRFVNSAQDFQAVTKVSDSLLASISPYFKFPDWVNSPKKEKKFALYEYKYEKNRESFEKPKFQDINLASKEDFMAIYGIGEAISTRIISFKESLGGFVSMQQMNDVWGLTPDLIERLNARFKIMSTATIKKIDINNASLKELSVFPYFRYPIAKNIVTYRSMYGDLKTVGDLTKIKGLSIENAEIIALYLNF